MAIISNGTTVISGGSVSGAAPTTAQVLTAIAGLSYGAVGTHAILYDQSGGTTRDIGATAPGSNYRYSSTFNARSNYSASGTWRCLGYSLDSYNSNGTNTTLWVRIS